MDKKFKMIIILSCCIVCLIIGGAVGLVSCEKSNPNNGGDQFWTSNY